MTKLAGKKVSVFVGPAILFALIFYWKASITMMRYVEQKRAMSKVDYSQNAVDVVYTWVNGSDPKFLQTLNKELIKSGVQNVDSREQRYYDNGIMRYSMRALEVNAPWIRNVYVVTNGQVPCWLNTDNPRVKMIFHKDIFDYESHLPSFSSPAIECHIHKIPGLSEDFLYFNDDIMLGAPIGFDDFYTPEKGYKTYFAYPGLSLIKEKDFVDHFPNETNLDNIFLETLRYTSRVFKDELQMEVTDLLSHVPHLINRSIMTRLQSRLARYFNMTSSHKFRHFNDLQVPNAYFSFLKGDGVPNEQASFWLDLLIGNNVRYYPMTNNWRTNDEFFHAFQLPKFYCLNDLIDYSSSYTAMLAVDGIKKFLLERYPNASSFEIPDNCFS